MKKPYSGRKVLRRMIFVLMAVSLVGLLAFGTYGLRSTQQELLYCNQAAMEVYMGGMQYILSDLSSFTDEIYASDPNFRMLALESDIQTQEQRQVGWSNLRRTLQSRITVNTAIMVFDRSVSAKYYTFGQKFMGGSVDRNTVDAMQEIRSFWIEQGNRDNPGWQVYTVDDEAQTTILMQARKFKNLYICAMADLTAYSPATTEDNSAIAFSFLTSEQILTNREYVKSVGLTLENMLGAADGQFHTISSRVYINTRFLDDTGLGLCGIIPTAGMWGNWWYFVVLLVLTMAAICAVFFIMYWFTEKVLIYPLQKISEATQSIAQGNAYVCADNEVIQEYVDINDALEKLVEQKVLLQEESTRQEQQKKHALLQYYQLQTRSHFFLNCLKSLYNMTGRGEQEKTLRIITRFSNHIRYVFHDSLTFVSVQAELEEVDDYYEIIGLERADHILLTKSVDPELMDYPVPPLLIQTFLENFQKHNPQTDKILRFAIRIDRVELEEEDYVRIRLSDNGIGYSEEALNQLQQMDGVFAQFHVGIQNLCRRIEILYGNRHKTAFFNMPNGGACSVFYLPADYLPQRQNNLQQPITKEE